jgi:tRNA(His) 5'-end guanylyltransferase
MKNDEFGNRMKDYEKRFTDIRVAPEEILCVRLDGKGFSKFTKGFKKPFDDRLTQSMVQTAEALVNETDAQVGYTQSDEITLIYTLYNRK